MSILVPHAVVANMKVVAICNHLIAGLIDAIRQLMNPPAPARRGIGFTANIDSRPGNKK
ncbi:MAG: hypothetical protein Q8J99_10650 [Sulfuritalea sp.]|nr:hypothetical protein [Sulfuritalea sp.]